MLFPGCEAAVLSPGAKLMAAAPGKDLQRKWFFTFLVSVDWTVLQLGRCRAYRQPAFHHQPWHVGISHHNASVPMLVLIQAQGAKHNFKSLC